MNNQLSTLKQKAKLICMQQTDMHDACMLVSCLVIIVQIKQYILPSMTIAALQIPNNHNKKGFVTVPVASLVVP